MNKRMLCAAALVLAVTCLGAFAQEKKQISLTLEDSIVRALKNNLSVAVQVFSPELARTDVSKAREFFMPTFELQGQGQAAEQPSTWSLQSSGNVGMGTSAAA